MMQAIQLLQSKSTAQHPSTQQVNHSPPMDLFLVSTPMDIFQSLINNLDSEGRYLFLNAVANQLRYPNNHTHYFSFVLLYLFAEAKQVRFIISSSCISISFMSNRYGPWSLIIFITILLAPLICICFNFGLLDKVGWRFMQ